MADINAIIAAGLYKTKEKRMKKMRMFSILGLVTAAACLVTMASCSNNALIDEEDIVESSDTTVNASRSASSSTVTYSAASDICTYLYDGYNGGTKGPIIITKGLYKKGSTSKTVYLVTLSGTENVSNQTTGYLTDALSGFNLDNLYYANTVNTIVDNIPKNANLILAGHSLGGMICQQVASNSTIKSRYNVMNTVTFGSPLLAAGTREGTVKRLGDTSDIVPYLSGSLINNTVWAIAGLNRENGGYGTDVYHAHTESYLRSDVWGKYDITGTKNGGATLTLYLSTKTFYKSSTTVTD